MTKINIRFLSLRMFLSLNIYKPNCQLFDSKKKLDINSKSSNHTATTKSQSENLKGQVTELLAIHNQAVKRISTSRQPHPSATRLSICRTFTLVLRKVPRIRNTSTDRQGPPAQTTWQDRTRPDSEPIELLWRTASSVIHHSANDQGR